MTTDSGIYASWENAKATGGVTISYELQVTKIKLNSKAYNKDGTVVTEATIQEVDVTYAYSEYLIPSTNHNIINTFLPGLEEKVTAKVRATNSSGNSAYLTSTTLSVVESVDAAQTPLTGVEIKVVQNPIETGNHCCFGCLDSWWYGRDLNHTVEQGG